MKVPVGSQILQRSFAHQGAVLWNALPQDIRQSKIWERRRKKYVVIFSIFTRDKPVHYNKQ